MNAEEKRLFILESHLHTAEVSPCGSVSARDGARALHRAGYHGFVVTDHYIAGVLEPLGDTDENRINAWLAGYRAARDEGNRLGMPVLLGAELRLREGPEDILLYGPDEEFFLRHPRLYDLDLAGLYALAEQNGCLLIQAHPFRPGLQALPPRQIHGVEVFNGNPRHDSRNDQARAFQVKHRLLATAGSDYHQPGDESVAMVFERPILTPADFVRAVREGSFSFRQLTAAG